MATRDLEELFRRLETRAAGLCLLVFPALPHSESDVDWQGEADEFVEMAAAVPVRVFYLTAAVLELPDVEDLEDSLRVDGALAPDDATRVDDARRHLGEIVVVGAAFVVDGIVHRFETTADWWERIQSVVAVVDVAHRVQRSGHRSTARAELDAFVARHDELVAGLAWHRPFYVAVNDDARRQAAVEFDPELRRFLDPQLRRDMHLAAGYSRALDMVRVAAHVVRVEVRPARIQEFRSRIDTVAAHACDELAAATKAERRRRAAAAVEADLGFACPELTDELTRLADQRRGTT